MPRPKARAVYAYGPSSSGNARERPAKTQAMKMQPTAVISHAGRAFIPYGASDAGNMKMPTPMVLPTTRAVHITSPRARVRVSATGRAFLLGLAEIAGSDFGGHRLRFRRLKTRLLPAAPKERECEHGLTYR